MSFLFFNSKFTSFTSILQLGSKNKLNYKSVCKSFSANFDSVVIANISSMIISSIICYLTINDDNILGYFGFHLRDPWRDS